MSLLALDGGAWELPVPRAPLARAQYHALHEAIRLPLIAAHRAAFARFGARPRRDRELERHMRRRYRALLRRDFDNASSGVYPLSLLFDVPLARYASALPQLARDLPSVLQRLHAGDYRDLPQDIDYAGFPEYYRRNFHWQTDGYFSRHSAELYDLAVELLFIGCADVMRRQVLAQVMHRTGRGSLRLLDVGAGTGRFLAQAAVALPDAELVGIELSPWYADFARDSWRERDATNLRMHAGNAEALPFDSGSFDVVTSIYLLHELPRAARRKVLSEMRRVLAPGGLLVLEDAAQPSDSAEIAPALAQFSRDMHEPFFADYLRDDLAELAAQAGFRVQQVTPHFVSKVVSATLS